MNINELNNLVLSNEIKYNRIIIDLVDEAEDIIDFTDDKDLDVVYYLDKRIFIENLLTIIDLKYKDDIFVLIELGKILKHEQEQFIKRISKNKKNGKSI